MRRNFADTRFGQLHYVEEGEGHPVLLLHQTPRSWDEYREVIPLLSATCRVIAPDTLRFGCSDSPDEPWSIELFATGSSTWSTRSTSRSSASSAITQVE